MTKEELRSIPACGPCQEAQKKGSEMRHEKSLNPRYLRAIEWASFCDACALLLCVVANAEHRKEA